MATFGSQCARVLPRTSADQRLRGRQSPLVFVVTLRAMSSPRSVRIGPGDPGARVTERPGRGQAEARSDPSDNPSYIGDGIAVGLLAVVVRRWVCAGPPRPRGGGRRRSAAKALTNALTPAHVIRVRIPVSYDGTTLPVTVNDDGVDGADTEGSSGPGDGTSVHAILRVR